VLRTEQSEIVNVVTDDWLRTQCADAGEAALLRALQVQSMLIVPLIARAHAIGVLTFLSLHEERSGEEGQVVLAENFAGRAALAIDNARLYRDARRATRAREHVLGVVSHDLRNPLSAIAMCARVLLETPPADEADRAELAKAICDAASWMSRMIQDLLDASAIEAGVLSVVRERTTLGPIVTRAMDLFAHSATSRGLALERAGAADDVIVQADSERITQAIANLLGNALKFTPSSGRVTVSTTELGDEVAIVVEDTGCGIGAEDLAHVFDRYWHAGHANAGTGLGLTIASGIAAAHNGRIAVSSTPGAGSRFTLILPRAPDLER
jgi:signal transduction histidine kinase